MHTDVPSNWVSSHPPSEILIPTIAYRTLDGNQLLGHLYVNTSAEEVSDNNTYSAPLEVHIFSYQCEPANECGACARGEYNHCMCIR